MNVHTVEKISCSHKEFFVLVGPSYGCYHLLEREREREMSKCTSQFPYKYVVYGLRPCLCRLPMYTHMDACVCRVMLGAANTQLAGRPVDYRHIESGRHELIHFSASPTPNIESLGQAPLKHTHTHTHALMLSSVTQSTLHVYSE